MELSFDITTSQVNEEDDDQIAMSTGDESEDLETSAFGDHGKSISSYAVAIKTHSTCEY
jgi:hypothetical protein